MTTTIFIGNIVHCAKPFELSGTDSKFLAVKKNKIIAFDDLASLHKFKSANPTEKLEEIRLKKSQLLIPGFVDTHIHAVQYPNIGLGYDKPLLDWLDCYTFPLEKKFSNTQFAKKVFQAVVKNTLKHGTTTACYFGSLFSKATLILAESVVENGQRALVGKINMTQNSPKDYCETSQETVQNTKAFVDAVLRLNNDRVKPIITPRFAISVDMDTMKAIAKIAQEHNLHIQTHISENLAEIDFVRRIFNKRSYAEVYDEAGLLTRKTILAHGVHLEDSEIELLKTRETSISHCPLSNTCLQSGQCDVKKLTEKGICVGLGTDVAGGPLTSIYSAMRDALATSSHVSFTKTGYKPLNFSDVFYMATLGGATSLAMEDEIGNFEPGKKFDALLIDMDIQEGCVDCLQEYSILELLQKFIYTGDDRNIVHVYVDGNLVKK